MSTDTHPLGWPDDVRTLAIDVGGSGFKAAVLDPFGVMLTERVRVDTPYPCTPDTLVSSLVSLTEHLGVHHRVSVGFPGLVRNGKVRNSRRCRELPTTVRPTPSSRQHGAGSTSPVR